MTKRKIGILGGTFNPIHFGHINLAIEAKEKLGLDYVLFIPNNIPPHKDFNKYENINNHRLNMLKIALKNYPYFQYSDIEIVKQGISYTYETIEILSNIFKDDELYFIMGDDSFLAFHTWVKPERICANAKLIVGKRDNIRDDFLLRQKHTIEKMFNADITIIENKIVKEASSDIRKESMNKNIPKDVLTYIKNNNLYENDNINIESE